MDDKEYDMEKTRLSLKEIMKKDMEDELLHGVKVCNLAFHFGKRLGLSYDRAIELATAGLLHDMGKLQMSRRLYGRDEESLEVEEIVRTRSHSRITYDILMRYDYSDFILETILYHHENYDGTGYDICSITYLNVALVVDACPEAVCYPLLLNLAINTCEVVVIL